MTETGSSIYLIRVDHHNGAMSLETTFPIPIGYRFIHAHGQGRVVGFLIKRLRGFPLPQAVVIHLDHPGVSMVSEVSSDYDAGVSNLPSPHATGVTEYKVVLVPSEGGLHPSRNPINHLQYPVHSSLRNPQFLQLILWC